jgi:hypothetical protein
MFVRISSVCNVLMFSVVFFALTLVSCGNDIEDNQEEKVISEGIIYYSISYPYYKDDFMVVLLPDIMTMEFKNNIYKNTVTKGGLFTTTLISDCKKKELILMLDFGSKHIYARLDKNSTDTMLTTFPIPDLLKVPTTDSLAGLFCEKHMAVYSTLEDGYDAEIYTSSKIGIENSNWCNQFNELPDVMLGYEVSQYGLVMNFRADSISESKINESVFIVPEGFKEVSLEQMLFQMQEIFNQIIE